MDDKEGIRESISNDYSEVAKSGTDGYCCGDLATP